MANMMFFNSHRKAYLSLIFSILISLHFCHASAIEKNDRFDQARIKIQKHLEENNVPSIAVAIAKDGAILWEEAFGFADVDKKIKATAHTMYSLASISKPMTATGLMLLVERGLVDLDQPANNYLGAAKLRAFEGDAAEATVKRILLQTAGLPMHWNFFFENNPYQHPDMEETIRRYGILVTPPGEQFNYANLGYGIIEYIIERVSRKPYPEFMKTEIFEPLGLTRTAVITAPFNEEYFAQRYIKNGDVLPFYDFDHRGASAIYSSAHDLVRFGMFHLKNNLPDQKQVLSDETIDAMQTTIDPKVPTSSYRLGWWIGQLYGYRFLRHGGEMPGVRTSITLIPSENAVAVVLSNGENASPIQVTEWLCAAVLPNIASEERRSDDPRNMPHNFKPPKSLIGTWEGEIQTYSKSIPVRLIIEKTGQTYLKFLDDTNANEKAEATIKPPRFSNGIFVGYFPQQLPTEDAARNEHWTVLRLQIKGNSLRGVALAYSIDDSYSLPSYTKLEKSD
ncbi:beta-lactamase family protein [candidate division KSB1 bacterium]|nr:beta-lactamase family protein [candidate division KSB1 bacterium]